MFLLTLLVSVAQTCPTLCTMLLAIVTFVFLACKILNSLEHSRLLEENIWT